MLMPKLKLPVIQERSTCQGKDNCATCPLHISKGGRCGGCNAERLAPDFIWCTRECMTCAGFKTRYPAICCRSGLKDSYLTLLTKGAENPNHPEFTYTAQPALRFKQRALLYISSSVNTVTKELHMLYDEGNKPYEVVAVNLSRVWTKDRGFLSRDLKDYLSLPSKTKLLLICMTLDDLLLRAFESELYADPEEYRRCNIDYWMPLAFSVYPNEPRMHQIAQFYKTLYCTERAQAHWVVGDYFQPDGGINIDDLYLKAVEQIPQVIFNLQFVTNDETLMFHLRVLAHSHRITPSKVAFWFVGSANPTAVHNIRRVCGARDLYFLSPRPLLLAAKGQSLLPSGKSASSTDAKMDLLNRNYATFAEVIRRHGA